MKSNLLFSKPVYYAVLLILYPADPPRQLQLNKPASHGGRTGNSVKNTIFLNILCWKDNQEVHSVGNSLQNADDHRPGETVQVAKQELFQYKQSRIEFTPVSVLSLHRL